MIKEIIKTSKMDSIQRILDTCVVLERMCMCPVGCYYDEKGLPRYSSGLNFVTRSGFFEDPLADMFYKSMVGVAEDVEREDGCCGFEAMIMMSALMKRGIMLLTSGMKHRELIAELDQYRAQTRVLLQSQAAKHGDDMIPELLRRTDSELGDCLVQAIDEVGLSGLIQFGESGIFSSKVEISAGHSFAKGFMTTAMSNESSGTKCVMHDPLIVVSERPIVLVEDLLYFVTQATKLGKPLVLIVEHVEDKPLQMMLFNNHSGQFSSVAVQAPKFGTERKIFLSDIASITGATVITADIMDLGDIVDNEQTWVFGGAKRVEIDKDKTVIFDGNGDAVELGKRLAAVRREMGENKSDFLADREALLSGKIAKLYVGGTDSEAKSSIRRAEGMLRAARIAHETGVMADAPSALAYVAAMLPDAYSGVGAMVAEALFAPLAARLVGNDMTMESARRMIRTLPIEGGYDAETGKLYQQCFGNMKLSAAGSVIDAADRAFSMAKMLLSSEYVVFEILPEEKTHGKAVRKKKTIEEIDKMF